MVIIGLPTRRSTSCLLVFWGVIEVKSPSCSVHFGRTPSWVAHPARMAAATVKSRVDRFICVPPFGPDRRSTDPGRLTGKHFSGRLHSRRSRHSLPVETAVVGRVQPLLGVFENAARIKMQVREHHDRRAIDVAVFQNLVVLPPKSHVCQGNAEVLEYRYID